MKRRTAGLLVGGTLALAAISPAPAAEPGVVVTPFAATQGTPTSLAFGPDTSDASGETKVLYVTDGTSGDVLAIDAVGVVSTFATGFRSPLGVLADDDGNVYVADAESAREGPFGVRSYGRVWRVTDTNADGVADKKVVLLKNLPNGRHNTNGMAFGPDGMLYVANGNSTDDGIEGGESEVHPWSGSLIRVDPKAKRVSVTKLPRSALLAHGWRNVYDVAFSPVAPTMAFVPMNGIDDARKGSTGENPIDPNLEDSDDLLYATDVGDRVVDDAGFPSCLYNQAEKGNLKPYASPNPDVIKKFGRCPKREILRPVATFGLHTSSDGLAFQTTDAWGEDYVNDLFVAEWGSLFGEPAGHDIVRVQLDESGTKVVSQNVFVEMDLPLDLTFDEAGAMFVADYSGTIFKVERI